MAACGTGRGGDLGTVEDRFFEIRDFRLQNGTVMPRVTLAYETYGDLAADGRNAVLITHGYTNGHHAAGRNPANGNQPGWWDGLIGPGKAIDTGRLYGPDFPAISATRRTGRSTPNGRPCCANSWRR